jgi:HK97 family phage portal protein
MDILGRILGEGDLRAGVPGPTDDYWYQAVGMMTDAGVRVDVDQAKKLSAWYRGRDILATVLAMLPLPVLERLPNDGGSQAAPGHPLYNVLHDKPNAWQDSFQWRRQKMFHLIDHGNSYDWIVPGARGFADQLCPIDPRLVTPKQQSTTLPNGAVVPGRVLYDVKHPKTNITKTFTQDEVFHLRGASDDGVVGKGILEYARSSLGTALATESYAANIFSRGTLNGGVIENPGLLDPDASKRMARSFITAAKDWHLPKVLEQGSKFVKNDMTPEDFQMLLSRKFTVDDIARWLGIPRHMLENSDPSFGNAEQFNQNFIDYSMGPWLSLWEFAISDQLILATHKYFAQFTRQALVRGNLKDRVEAHVAMVNAGIESVDEARAVEDKPKRGGKADELREPQNITGKPAAAAPGDKPNGSAKPPTRAGSDDARVRGIVTESAARLLRKEIAAAQKAAIKFAAEAGGWEGWATSFYAGHVSLVAKAMQLDAPIAELYCDSQRDALITDGIAAAETWTTDYLVGLALDAPRPTLS